MMAIPPAQPMTGPAVHAFFSFEMEEAVNEEEEEEEEEDVETVVVTVTVVPRGLVGRDSELVNDAKVCQVVPAEARRIIQLSREIRTCCSRRGLVKRKRACSSIVSKRAVWGLVLDIGERGTSSSTH
jgi:hypothetical protein